MRSILRQRFQTDWLSAVVSTPETALQRPWSVPWRPRSRYAGLGQHTDPDTGEILVAPEPPAPTAEPEQERPRAADGEADEFSGYI